ncbi:metallo-beta-lactamase domain containing protein [Rhodotorula toruloides]|uniref:BY PROTMAP: gi/472580485/gb/EMS18281.1/ metallo-beta-lactamase domain containing protein [Rhodosporidium toruloides NP11] gi/647402287/emb/CDR48569.1/ RHTO0S18e03004g1_1 [Rhodosporidium toruloides] n=1 Tax=Rhodotorula toruloides TaxID=5286 RepID=A0A0K3CBX8_RHOTO|nr:metallo-beta-lactamase domain containing protein [Rhodotorula toruloides]PRQ75465.1 Beta-lactamase-like protein [Rhodotorula toruloides]
MYRYPHSSGFDTPSASPSPSPPPARSSSKPYELLFLGTACSSALPNIACTTDPVNGCDACLDTVGNPGNKNIRGNTGCVLRVPRGERQDELTILIDCGKTFREQALKFFPQHGLRKIDACILTHAHADAIDGLDDLRMWTYDSAIERTIPIYCTRTTYDQIASSFTYMVSKAAASGSGALPSFDWHVMREDEEWDVCGVKIVPIPVEHGHYFDRKTGPQRPLIALGFLIDSTVLYLSDVSRVPEPQITRLATYLSLPSSSQSSSSSSISSAFSPTPRLLPRPLPTLDTLIIDTCSLFSPHPRSHFTLPQALSFAARLGARKTYLTDLPHGVSHAAWLEWSTAFSSRGAGPPRPPQETNALLSLSSRSPRSFTRAANAFIASYAAETGEDEVAEGRWVRPAFDGLVLSWEGLDEEDGEGGEEGGGRVWDSAYD